jgi:surfeit locus 1 family protein
LRQIPPPETRHKIKFPILSLFVCGLGVIGLLTLGIWQINRLEWKNTLQKNLDIAFAANPPAALTQTEFRKLGKNDLKRGVVKGSIDFSKSLFFHGRIQEGKSVIAVVAPVTIPSLNLTIPAEIGCSYNPQINELRSAQNKSILLKGIIRKPRWSFATPKNGPAENIWWRLDSDDLKIRWGIHDLENVVMTIENTADFSSEWAPCLVEKKLRNDHASYAIFWFTMAFVLSILWAVRFLRPYLQSA